MARNNRRSRNIERSKKMKEEYEDKRFIKNLSYIIFFLVFLLICVGIFYWLKNTNYYNNLVETFSSISEKDSNSINNDVTEKEEEEETDITFTMTALGDVMCHSTQYVDAYVESTGEYDFSYVFDEISSYTKLSDICVGNMETTFAGEEKKYSGYPRFNSPDNLAYSLKKIGVDVLSTANNHSLDTNFFGLSRTIDVLDNADISHLGTYKTQEDRDKILFKYVKGVKIAFINYTYGTNGIPIPSGKSFCVNLIDKNLIQKDIETAKSQNADMIVACMHWGTEYRTTANAEQKDLADFLFQNGVNVILGNHPHVLEQMEKRTVTLNDGTSQDGFVIYSCGNFISGQNDFDTKNSIILDLTITKHTDGKITIDKANYTPIYMYKANTSNKQKMKLFDIEKKIENYENGSDTSISKTIYSDLKNRLSKIKSIVGEEIN